MLNVYIYIYHVYRWSSGYVSSAFWCTISSEFSPRPGTPRFTKSQRYSGTRCWRPAGGVIWMLVRVSLFGCLLFEQMWQFYFSTSKGCQKTQRPTWRPLHTPTQTLRRSHGVWTRRSYAYFLIKNVLGLCYVITHLPDFTFTPGKMCSVKNMKFIDIQTFIFSGVVAQRLGDSLTSHQSPYAIPSIPSEVRYNWRANGNATSA